MAWTISSSSCPTIVGVGADVLFQCYGIEVVKLQSLRDSKEIYLETALLSQKYWFAFLNNSIQQICQLLKKVLAIFYSSFSYLILAFLPGPQGQAPPDPFLI